MFPDLADSIAQLAWTARPDGHVFWFNRRWYDYTGLRPDQAEGWNWTRALDPRELPRVLTGVASHFSEGTAWEDSFALRRSDGAMRAHLGRALPVHDAGGNVSMWVGTFTDITGRRSGCAARPSSCRPRCMCGPLAGSVSIGETLQGLLIQDVPSRVHRRCGSSWQATACCRNRSSSARLRSSSARLRSRVSMRTCIRCRSTPARPQDCNGKPTVR
ncbi:MAG: PAS domain-containing protein [Betaproteobacteria bacterium]|nr:PAS domain-containing protein [Betaproteobacteria bacterium]